MTIEDLNDKLVHAPRDHEVLVAASDPERGPYTKAITVAKTEVGFKCSIGYRRITWAEQEEMHGDVEDFTSGWKHSVH